MPRIKILQPNLTILGEVREVGAIVNDPDPNECRNLVADGRAANLTPEEDSSEEKKEQEAIEDQERAEESADSETQKPA